MMKNLFPPHFDGARQWPRDGIFRIFPVLPVHTPRRCVPFSDVVTATLRGPAEQHKNHNHHEDELGQTVVQEPAHKIQDVLDLESIEV